MAVLHSEVVSFSHRLTLHPVVMAAEYYNNAKQQENEEQQTSDYSSGANNNRMDQLMQGPLVAWVSC